MGRGREWGEEGGGDGSKTDSIADIEFFQSHQHKFLYTHRKNRN